MARRASSARTLGQCMFACFVLYSALLICPTSCSSNTVSEFDNGQAVPQPFSCAKPREYIYRELHISSTGIVGICGEAEFPDARVLRLAVFLDLLNT